MPERVNVTQAMCDHAELLLKGGANHKTAARILGISAATVSRIKTAGFSAIVFAQNTERRRIEEREKKEQPADKEENTQVPGQLAMDLPVEHKKEQAEEQTKMMRFLAAKFEQMHKDMMLLADEIRKIPSF